MPVILNLEDKIINLIRGERYKWFTTGVNLGGVTGVSGGTGAPIGGFIGQLVQSKVTYDTTENEIWDIPVSGESLVTNLDRIRYRISDLEAVSGGGSSTFLGLTDTPSDYTGYAGYSTVVNGGEDGLEFIDVDTDTKQVKVSSNDTTEGYLEDKIVAGASVTVTTLNDGSDEDLEISVSGLSVLGHSHVEVDITDLEHDAVKIQSIDVVDWAPTVSGEVLVYDGNVYAPGTIGGSSTFLDLTDVDEASYTGFEGYSVVVNTGEDGLEFVNVSGGAGSTTFLDLTDTPSVYTDKYGYSAVVNLAEDGLEFINVSGGAGSSYTYALEDITGQVPGAGDDYTLAATPASGSLSVHLNGLTQQPNNYNIITGGFHTDFTAVSGDELVASYYTDVPSESILGLTLEVEDTDVSVATNVEILNFEGMEVTDEGGGKVTISGGTGTGGGGDVSVEDEGIEITAGVTSLDFVGSMVTATNVGDDVTVTLSGFSVDLPSFRGVRLYKSTDQTVLDDSSWHEVSWNSEVYDEGGFHTGTNDYIEIPANDYGYYRFTGSITFSGVQPTAGLYQLAIFKDWTGVASMFEGNYATSSGIYTLVTTADYYCNDAADYRLRYICTDAAADVVLMSGIANSYFSAHKIQAVVADLSDTPNCCRIYNNGYATDPLNETWTDADFTDEAYDTNTFFTYASSHYKFTFHDAGYYNVVCKIQSPGNPGSIYNMSSRALLNDTTVIAQVWDKILDNSNYNQGRTLLIEFDYHFDEDDYIEFQVWQDSGGQVTDFIKPDGNGADSYVAIHQIYGD